MSQLAFEARKPKLDSWSYSCQFPGRFHVVRNHMDHDGDKPWMVWRGNAMQEDFVTFDEAVNWALRAAWGVEVIGHVR